MSGKFPTQSVEALRENLRALARTNRTVDKNELATLAKEAGLDFTAEDIEVVAGQLSNELGEDELEHVAGGAVPRSHVSTVGNQKGVYDYSSNKKI